MAAPSVGGFGRKSVVLGCGGETVDLHGRSVDGAAPALGSAAEKYSVTAEIGEGGMGRVLLVQDRDLRREVAMKVMNAPVPVPEEQRLRFVAEAQATAQLEHPGIPPVHDLGITTEGKLFFTMKLVRGTTLREVLQNLLLNRREFRQEYSLHRLMTILERICEALHFAHEKGVLHRDLKPENIMLGDFGEVHVMDWGLARVRGETADPADAVATAGTDAGLRTLDGDLKGTVPYMSPEQALGLLSKMDRRSDLWSLGCVLFETLTLYRAFDGENLLPRVQKGEHPPVRTRNPRRAIPEDLALLCERCLSVDPAGRPPTAKAVGHAIRKWLDGSAEKERRHAEAQALVAKGTLGSWAHYKELKAALAKAEAAVEEKAGMFQPWQPAEECLPLLEARMLVQATRRGMVHALADTTTYLEAALLAEVDNAAARTALGAVWTDRHGEAERNGSREEAAYALDMMTRYDDGRLARVVSGEGSLTLTSEPAGAEVFLLRYEDWHGILKESARVPLGRTPLGPRDLPMGSYLCILRMEGFPDVRYPVHVTRNRAWEGHVTMRTAAEIGEGFVLVPGGPFVHGEGRRTGILDLPDFAIQRFPVTMADWGEFLRAVEAEKGIAEAAKFLAGSKGDGAFVGRTPEGLYLPLPVNVEGPARERCLREYGPDFELRLPVQGLDWSDASAYCRWRTRTTGMEWRIPTEEEREKAARGVDGRRFPWGDLEHASMAKCDGSRRDERSQPEPVGTFPTAASVYGMGDAAGNSWDWTDSWYDPAHSLRVLRGGSWNDQAVSLRCAYRNRFDPGRRYSDGGLRAARSLPAVRPA